MKDKIRAKQDHQYSKDYLLLAALAYDWRKKRPDNDELKALCITIADVHTYVQGLQNENRVLKELLDEKQT